MARRRQTVEHQNHDRWLVSYADFITLLFAFFVVMYSVSSVNEGKYRVLSDSIISAFHDPLRSMDPIQIGNLIKVRPQDRIDMDYKWSVIPSLKRPYSLPDSQQIPGRDKALDEAANELANAIQLSMADLIDQDLVTVRRTKEGVEVEIKSSILFSSGSAELSEDSVPVLQKISEKLKPLDITINVEGYTDNVPIHNSSYPSNWELSAARSVSVVHLFAKLGIRPGRLAAVGYGEFRPVADNSNEKGRLQNRRVVLGIRFNPGQKARKQPVQLMRKSITQTDSAEADIIIEPDIIQE